MYPVPSSHGLEDACVCQGLPGLEAWLQNSVEIFGQVMFCTFVIGNMGCASGVLEFADKCFLNPPLARQTRPQVTLNPKP